MGVGVVAAGCSGASSSAGGESATASAGPRRDASHQRARHRKKHQRHRSRRATHAHGWQRLCPAPSRVLDGVYHPERLAVLSPCRIAAGVVDIIRTEEDGDLHFDVTLDPGYRSLLAPANAEQNGDLVVEFMPRDYGHLPSPHVGERVTLVGAWVDDTQHAWNEFHPVWAVRVGDGPWQRSGPQFGGSPPSARSYDALTGCRTAAGAQCQGYGRGSSSAGGSARHSPSAGRPANCDSNYKDACLDPGASDYDCEGGSGDGPKYVRGPIQVVGDDHYQLDANGDGIACTG